MHLPSSSEKIVAAVDSLRSAVVRIEGQRRSAATGLVWSGDGLILTANHALGRASVVRVALGDDDSAQATIVGRDPSIDLALLRIDPAELTHELSAPDWRVDGPPSVGELALAVARPGRTVRAAMGMISVVGDGVQTRAGRSLSPYVELDRVLPRGFAAAPIIDLQGRVLGLSAGALSSDTTVVLGHAAIASTVDTLVEHGRVPQGFLGVGVSLARLPVPVRKEVGQGRALAVVGVAEDGPAANAGLLVGDLILSVDGTAVRSASGLRAKLADRAGQPVALRLLRGGQTTALDITAGERP